MSTESTEVPVGTTNPANGKGLFADKLYRPNSQIKRERADEIIEDAEIAYQRRVQDMARDLRNLKRDRDRMIDLSPGTRDTLQFPDFRGSEFTEAHIKLTVDIYNLEKKVQLAMDQYQTLFGKAIS